MFDKLIVRDWMTYPVITASPETDLVEAREMMEENEIRRLPVVADNGKLAGIISLSDLREAFGRSDHESLTLEDIMTEDVVAVPDTELVRNVAIYMLDHKIGGVPVVDVRGEVVGIVTESDILRVIIEYEEY